VALNRFVEAVRSGKESAASMVKAGDPVRGARLPESLEV
jgi:hypothetical protein